MNIRLDKRHKRKVSRARDRVIESQPDIRTPEQLNAAREASGGITRRMDNSIRPYATSVKSKSTS